MAAQIRTVGVIATGVIGSSWVALFLSRGLRVLVCSTSVGAKERLTKYLEGIWPTLEPSSLAPGASMSSWEFVGDSLDGHYDRVDFIQENAPEALDLKRRIMAEADAATRPDVIIASSSSGLPASSFVADCGRHPGRVLVGHPYNPPHLMPLVEVVPHPQADADATGRAMDFYRSLGREPVLVRKEVPGFVANRLQAAVLFEAYSLVLRGVATAEEIDKCMTASIGPRWAFSGPFMTLALGGGGGRGGFSRILNALMGHAKVWADDMREHQYDLDPAKIPDLDASVQQMLDKYGGDTKEFEKERDRLLVELLKAKDAAPALQGVKQATSEPPGDPAPSSTS